MKIFIQLLLFVLLSIPVLQGQSVKPIANFYNKYKKMGQVQDIKIQGWLLKMAATFAGEEPTHQLLKKISYLRVLIVEDGNLVDKKDHDQLMKEVRQSTFEPLIQIKDGKEKVDIMIREQGDTITDALIVVYGDDDFVLLSLEGKLKFSDLNDLKFDIEGAEHFEKIPEKKTGKPKA